MKFSVNADKLMAALNLAGQAVPNRSPKEVLRCVKIEARAGGSADLTGFNLEIGLVLALEGLDVEEPGVCLIDRHKLGQILAPEQGSDSTVFVEEVDGRIVLEVGGATYRLPRQDPDTYPAIDPFPKAGRYLLPGDATARALTALAPFTDPNSERFALGGCLVAPLADGKLELTAADGRRVALTKLAATAEGKPKRADQTVVPQKVMKLVAQVARGKDQVELGLDRNACYWRWPGGYLYGRLVEGRFPDVRGLGILPFDEKATAAVVFDDPEPIIRAVRKAMVTTSEESRTVTLEILERGLFVWSEAADQGSTDVDLGCVSETPGGDAAACLQPLLLLDALAPLAGRDEAGMRLEMFGPKSPVRVTAENWLAFVMTVGIDKEGKPMAARSKRAKPRKKQEAEADEPGDEAEPGAVEEPEAVEAGA